MRLPKQWLTRRLAWDGLRTFLLGCEEWPLVHAALTRL